MRLAQRDASVLDPYSTLCTSKAPDIQHCFLAVTPHLQGHPEMHRVSALLVGILLLSTCCFGGAFVSTTTKSRRACFKSTNPLRLKVCCRARHISCVPLSKRRITCIASKNTDGDERSDDTNTNIVDSDEIDERRPSTDNNLSFNIFMLFSYGIQFLGAFFGVGLILNLLGFGYTFDLERGLVVDRMNNIRNQVQFEREIERTERADLKGSASSKYIIAPRVPENNIVSLEKK